MPESTAAAPGGRWRALAGYLLMLIGTALAYWLVRARGLQLVAPELPAGAVPFGAGGGAAHFDALLHVLLALVVVIIVARGLGTLFAYFHQPPVVGEIVAGLLLGPSLLGRIAPAASAYILPPSVAPFLGVLSQVGVILYMFLVGLELDPALLRKRGHATVAISHASIVTPFLLGSTLALFIYSRLGTRDVPFTVFSLFLGVSMSVTAFPVLARILTDRKIHRSPMGVIALTCAAVDDVTAWCLLAFVVSVVKARASGAVLTFAMTLGYIAIMALVARPGMQRLALLYGTKGRLTQGVMASVFVALLLSALATDSIGIHAVFGAFALGAVIPHDSGLARELTDRLEDIVVVLLLPAFFAFTGMRTQIGLVSGPTQWLICIVIIVVASAGKFGGSLVAARLTGLGWRDASALGVLMNTRGLMELIVLNIGLELRVLSPELFAMLVLMAVVTTFMTTPILHLITRKQRFAEPPAEQAVPAVHAGGGILVPISNPDGLAPLIDLASAATRPTDPPPRVVALVRRPQAGVRSGLREADRKLVPRTPILARALDHARSSGAVIDAQAVWTDDPAGDILHIVSQPNMGWLLLGYHRPVFGGDLLGGVVKEVLDGLRGKPVHVGVVIHGHERALDRVIAVVDDSTDGRAGLELAARIVQKKRSTLHAVLVPEAGGEPSPKLEELIREASKTAGRWLHTDVLTQRNPAALAYQTHGDLVVIGMKLADELGLPLDDVPGAERCVLLVRGASAIVASAEQPLPDRAQESS